MNRTYKKSAMTPQPKDIWPARHTNCVYLPSQVSAESAVGGNAHACDLDAGVDYRRKPFSAVRSAIMAHDHASRPQ